MGYYFRCYLFYFEVSLEFLLVEAHEDRKLNNKNINKGFSCLNVKDLKIGKFWFLNLPIYISYSLFSFRVLIHQKFFLVAA